MEKIELEYNLLLEDYLAVEEFAYYHELNDSYKKLKKNTLLNLYFLTILLFTLGVYLAPNFRFIFLPLLIGGCYLFYRKYGKCWTWMRLEPKLGKHIINYQFKGDPEGMNNCKLIGDAETICVWTNNENTLFARKDVQSVAMAQDYFFIFDTRGIGIGIPLGRISESAQNFLEKW